jgi:uncharacterized protein YbjT (DUF2867 family)
VKPTIAVLGASGLIGQAVAEDLLSHGYGLTAIARRFTAAQRTLFGASAIERPLVAMGADTLGKLLQGADIVLNCVGVLQDGPRGRTEDAHAGFAARLVAAIAAQARPVLLLHVSIPGDAAGDATPFSRSKRAAEAAIAASGVPHAILRPGFVVAPAAFGGGAMIRALAALPFDLPRDLRARPFTPVAVGDIAATVRAAAELWPERWPAAAPTWDVMARKASSIGEVVDAFRARFGGPRPVAALPDWVLGLAAWLGDATGWLSWSPAARSTAIAELRRGVRGDPAGWISATGVQPATLVEALAALPTTVQERWFGRLYFAKPVAIAALSLFWLASGLVALGPAFPAATAALTASGAPASLAAPLTIATALADVAIGLGIAVRRTCRVALLSGVGLSLAYLAVASVLAPTLWLDPLGPLVKVGPAVVLMLVALAILPER